MCNYGGYSPKTARQIASQLQSHKEYPKVHAYIRSLQEDLWNKYKISPATHMRRLHEIGLRAENPSSKDINEFDMKPDLKTALAAEISRGKAAGYYEAKGVEERAIYFWPGAVARELSVNFREVEPLFTVHQPWTLELEPALERVLVPVPE
jgi:hypothetical protein